jgi:hypothetical protein
MARRRSPSARPRRPRPSSNPWRDPAYQHANTRSDWIEHTPDPGSGRLPVGIPNGDVVTLVFGLQARCGAVSGQFTAQAA